MNRRSATNGAREGEDLSRRVTWSQEVRTPSFGKASEASESPPQPLFGRQFQEWLHKPNHQYPNPPAGFSTGPASRVTVEGGRVAFGCRCLEGPRNIQPVPQTTCRCGQQLFGCGICRRGLVCFQCRKTPAEPQPVFLPSLHVQRWEAPKAEVTIEGGKCGVTCAECVCRGGCPTGKCAARTCIPACAAVAPCMRSRCAPPSPPAPLPPRPIQQALPLFFFPKKVKPRSPFDCSPLPPPRREKFGFRTVMEDVVGGVIGATAVAMEGLSHLIPPLPGKDTPPLPALKYVDELGNAHVRPYDHAPTQCASNGIIDKVNLFMDSVLVEKTEPVIPIEPAIPPTEVTGNPVVDRVNRMLDYVADSCPSTRLPPPPPPPTTAEKCAKFLADICQSPPKPPLPKRSFLEQLFGSCNGEPGHPYRSRWGEHLCPELYSRQSHYCRHCDRNQFTGRKRTHCAPPSITAQCPAVRCRSREDDHIKFDLIDEGFARVPRVPVSAPPTPQGPYMVPVMEHLH